MSNSWSQRVWANMSVKDVARTKAFYKALGFKLNGKGDENLVSFLFGRDGFAVNFFTHDHFMKNIGVKVSDAKKGAEIIFTIGATTRKEVEKYAEKAVNAGGKLFQKPEEINDWMYNCGFEDPDGHRWNVLYMDTE